MTDPLRPALGTNEAATEIMDRYGLYEDAPDLQERVQQAIRDPEVQRLMAQTPDLADLVEKLPKPDPFPSKLDPDFPNPDKPEQHADGFKLQDIANWVDAITVEEGFHMVVQAIPVDISAMAWMAKQRADDAMESVPLDETLEETEGLSVEEDRHRMERERLILMWLDAFVMGWKFHLDQDALDVIEGNRRFLLGPGDTVSPPRSRPAGNRKQRRKKR